MKQDEVFSNHKIYLLGSGKRVPSVTTIISQVSLGGVEGLLVWANRLGQQGLDHRAERDKAADAGTACHQMAEAYAKGTTFDRSAYSEETLEKADHAFRAFKEWAKASSFRIGHSEVSLVSEKYGYGGTLDCMLVNNQLALGDYKTSNSIRIGMLCQLAAYQQLWEETHPDEPITGGFHLLRFSKPDEPDDPVMFTHHYWENLNLAWEAFQHMRALYALQSRLRKFV